MTLLVGSGACDPSDGFNRNVWFTKVMSFVRMSLVSSSSRHLPHLGIYFLVEHLLG